MDNQKKSFRKRKKKKDKKKRVKVRVPTDTCKRPIATYPKYNKTKEMKIANYANRIGLYFFR